MNSNIKYKCGTLALLGDRVLVKNFFFFKDAGTVIYVPEISPNHPEMHVNGINYLGVKLDSKAITAVTIHPSKNIILNTQFLSRGLFQSQDELKADEVIFDEE